MVGLTCSDVHRAGTQSFSMCLDALHPAQRRHGWVQGWYAADRGPANTLYVPGALLAPCANEVVLLEMNRTSFAPAGPTPTGAQYLNQNLT